MPRRLIKDMIVEEGKPREMPARLNIAVRKVDDPNRKRKTKTAVYVVIITIVVFITIMALTSYLNSVTVKVDTKKEDSSIDSLVFLGKDTTESGKIRYSVMKFSESLESPVLAGSTTSLKSYSRGQVVLYNEFSSASIKLVAGTRLQASDGKIFKIDNAVVIPGFSGASQNIVPGTTKVTVTASQPGNGYNVSASQFSIPGLAGSNKFTKVYARSSSRFSGGFVGNARIVDRTYINKIRADLSSALGGKLLQEILSKIPPGYIFFNGDQDLRFEDNLTLNNYIIPSNNNSDYKITGTIYAVIIDKMSLDSYLFSVKHPKDIGQKIVVDKDDKLSVEIISKVKTDFENTKSIMVHIAGPVTFIWDFDSEALNKDLAGLTKSDYPDVLARFPSITKADVEFSIPWAWSFPSDFTKINIIKDFQTQGKE